jgi:hypothetical protein
MISHVQSPLVEFLIHDNTVENSKFVDYLAGLEDERVNYIHDPIELDMAGNFDKALSNSTGEYITCIGDDDFVHPFIVELLLGVLTPTIDCLVFGRGAYYWSDVEFENEFDFFQKASMHIPRECDLSVITVSSKEQIDLFGSKGGIYLFGLPACYHGIVKRTVLGKISSRFGSAVLGPSPDMALAIAIACTLDSYHYVKFPLTIAGASFNSAAGMGRRGDHSALLNDLPSWLPQDMSKKWLDEIPRIWNGFTVYAHTSLTVSRLFDRPIQYNYKALFSKMLEDNFKDLPYIVDTPIFREFSILDKAKIVLRGLILYELRCIFRFFPKFIKSEIVRRRSFFSDMEHQGDLYSVDDCMEFLKKLHQEILLKR